MKLTRFKLFKNTLFTDMQNTVHFNSNSERDSFFDNEFTGDNVLTFETSFNFRRDRGTLKVPILYENLMGFNYCRFVNGFDEQVYYAYIVSMTYLNDKTTQLDLVIDTVMTFTQGNVLENLQNVEIIRQHLPQNVMNNRMDYLRNNSDVLETYSMMFTNSTSLGSGVVFDEFYYVIQSAVVLDGDVKQFGTEDAPKMKTANGSTFDGISTPINLYLCGDDILTEWCSKMSDYPWIMQNVKTIIKIPKKLIDTNKLEKKTCAGVAMWRLAYKKESEKITLPFKLTLPELRKFLRLRDNESYLVRDNVINCYITDYRGNQLNFETGKIGNTNTIKISATVGVTNEINIFSEEYSQRNPADKKQGLYRDNQMTISQFDNVPVMIDNYTLNKANSAYSRSLENSRQISGRFGAITGKDSSLQDRLFNAVSVYSNVFSGGLTSAPAKAVGLFSDEYEYYRDQKAQMNQWKITPPTVSEGSYTNANLTKTGDYGIWLKVSTIDSDELNNCRSYYGKFGFEAMSNDNQIYNVNSWTLCNWLQFRGNYVIPDIDRELFDVLKTIFEGGVRLFHSYDYLKNECDFTVNEPIA